MSDIQDDIGADVAAAFASFDAGGDAPPAAAPEAAPPPLDPPSPADGPQRDEHGRFAPKAGDAPAQQPVAKSPEQAQPQAVIPPVPAPAGSEVPKTFVPPVVWSAEQKSQFASLPTWAQEAIGRREEMGEQGVAKLKQQLETYQPLEAIFAPHRDKWQMAGMNEAQAVQTLLAAQSYLERDAPAALRYLAQQFGATPEAIFGGAQGTPQGHQAQQAPELQALQRQVQDLHATISQQAQAAQERKATEVNSTIQAFSSDPKHLYFWDVHEDMAALMGAGRADSLETAYEMATWARPDIRRLIIAEQQRTEGQAAQERERQRVAGARQAGGSITGDSLGGHKPSIPGNPSASIEDDVRAAFDRAAGVV